MSQRPYTSSDKWVTSLIAGLLFLLLASPFAYSLTSGLFGESLSCPDLTMLTVHAVAYTLIIRLMMGSRADDKYSSKDKWIVSIIGGVLFMLLSSPFLYSAVDGAAEWLLNVRTSSKDGCPLPTGLAIHTAVFIIIIRILMR